MAKFPILKLLVCLVPLCVILQIYFINEKTTKTKNWRYEDIVNFVKLRSFVNTSWSKNTSSFSCTSILYNKEYNNTQVYPDRTTDQQVLEVVRQGCQAVKDRYLFPKENYWTQEEYEYPIAYSILVHQNTEQVIRLLSAIYAPQNVYCVHVDLKSPAEMVEAIKKIGFCFPNIFLATNRVEVVYASFSRLQADINCMEDLMNVPMQMHNWTYLINLCGQDFPLRTNLEIVQQLKELKNRNIIAGQINPSSGMLLRTKFVYAIENVTSIDGKVSKTLVRTSVLKSPPPFGIPVYKNLAYNIFSRRFLHWALLESEMARDLLEWSRDTATPDEHYWIMLDGLGEAPDSTGRISWWQLARYVVFRSESKPCRGYWRHYSCVFGQGDLPDILNTNKFFANKFDIAYDSATVTCLREWLDERRMGKNDPRNPHKMAMKINY